MHTHRVMSMYPIFWTLVVYWSLNRAKCMSPFFIVQDRQSKQCEQQSNSTS